MGKKKKHDLAARRRAFRIWQKLGYFPWRKAGKARSKDAGGFYKGAFDSIPFMNEDGKRTFSHLLLRPGYMIRDYIGGKHDNYLAPLASLIIFYAFFALVSAIMQPVQQEKSEPAILKMSYDTDDELGSGILRNTIDIVKRGYLFLFLDQYPDEVDTRAEAAVAALEGKLRSQGIPLFLGKFIFLWLAMSLALRKYRIGMSAAAAGSAYILCQFSFFMLFALLLSLGENTTIGVGLMAILMTIDYYQWLAVSGGKAFRLTVKTGLFYLGLFILFLLLISAVILLIAWIKA